MSLDSILISSASVSNSSVEGMENLLPVRAARAPSQMWRFRSDVRLGQVSDKDKGMKDWTKITQTPTDYTTSTASNVLTLTKPSRIVRRHSVGSIVKKCTCIRNEGWVSGICTCLKDEQYAPLIKIPKRPLPSMIQRNRNIRVSITPGWEQHVHRSDMATAYESLRSSSVYAQNALPEDKPPKDFRTGSTYAGQWNLLGMKGSGTYIMPHGVEYCGEFEDGQFHGNGTLTYPNGIKMDCIYDKGKMIKWDLKFDDGLEYKVPWDYCKMPDRRYYSEITDQMSPAGQSYITAEKPARQIPPGCYDTGDGYFDPKVKCVYSAYKPNRILRVATKLEEEWILANCRHEWDEPTQYRPDLYEKWVTGADEYTVERNMSAESLDSEKMDSDLGSHPRYMIGELMDAPGMISELTKDQFGAIHPETTVFDERNISQGAHLKTFGQQTFGKDGQLAMLSQLVKSKSGTVSLNVTQGFVSRTGSKTMIHTTSTARPTGSQEVVADVKSQTISGTNVSVLKGKAVVSTRSGVHVDLFSVDDSLEAEDESQIRIREFLTPLTEGVEDAEYTKRNILSLDLKKGHLDLELKSDTDQHGKVASASMHFREGGTQSDESITDISLDSYMTDSSTKITASIGRVKEKQKNLLITEIQRKASDDPISVDVKSIGLVDVPRKKHPPLAVKRDDEADGPMVLESTFEASTKLGDMKAKIPTGVEYGKNTSQEEGEGDDTSTFTMLDVPDFISIHMPNLPRSALRHTPSHTSADLETASQEYHSLTGSIDQSRSLRFSLSTLNTMDSSSVEPKEF